MGMPLHYPAPLRVRSDNGPLPVWRSYPPPHGYGTIPSRPSNVAGDPSSSFNDYSSADLPKDVSSRFGRRLREMRRARALTQVDMARKFGIDRSYISDVERGRKSISLPLLEVVAIGMGISLSEMLKDL